MMKTILSFLGVLLLSTVIFSHLGIAQVRYTNQTADLREGPAAYHEFLLRLYINNKVELDSTEGYWNRVWFKDTRGWLPSYTLSEAQISSDEMKSDSMQSRMGLMFSQLNNEDPVTEEDLTASPAQVSAAVKGFSEKWARTRGLDYSVNFERYLIEPASPTEFQNFIGVRDRPMNDYQQRRMLYPRAIYIPYPNPSIDQVGYAVASAVAQKGLVSNYPLQRYLDLISGLVVENSHRPELDFSILILDVDDIQGYSLPGNYIFISKGALKQMQTEAELVHFIAHEVAHLVFGHGIVEYLEQEPRIKQESMLEEMRRKLAANNAEDQATEEERTNEQRLTDMGDGFYDAINSERLEEYEFEADYWGIIYTYLSGYNPNEAVKYLERLQRFENPSESITEWNGLKLAKRITAVNSQISELNLGEGNTSSDLFQRLIDSLE